VRGVSGQGAGGQGAGGAPPRATARDQYAGSGYNAPSGYGPPAGHGPSGYGGQAGGYGDTAGGYGPPGQTHQLWAGGGSGYQAAGPQPPAPPRRGKALPFLVGLAVIVILAGAGALVLYLRGTGSPQTGSTSPVTGSSRAHASSGAPSSPATSSPAASSPGTVVTDYYNAINAHRFHAAYELNAQAQGSEPFANFRDGFAGTQNDVLTITGVSGETVSFRLTANQTDGSAKLYQGSYTVQNGKIVASNVVQTG